jgi:hypothetical protein
VNTFLGSTPIGSRVNANNRAREESRTAQEEDRHRHLENDQHLPHAQRCRHGPPAVMRLFHYSQMYSGCCRSQADDNAAPPPRHGCDFLPQKDGRRIFWNGCEKHQKLGICGCDAFGR